MYKTEHLKAVDYDELLAFLNRVFYYSEENGFDKQLPVMWARDDEHMSKHLAIKDKGKIAAVLGLYPLKVNIAGEQFTFATCGNIGTAPEYRGKGCMKELMDAAKKEMKRLNIDVARLGGQRQRYEIHGFEPIGTKYSYQLSPKNVSQRECIGILFKPIAQDDVKALQFAMSLQTNSEFYVDRKDYDSFYKIMCAWQNKPYIAYSADGTYVGVLSVSEDSRTIAEQYAVSPQLMYDMLINWLKKSGLDYINCFSSVRDRAFNRLIGADCEVKTVLHATNCRIMNWEKLCNAFIKLKREETQIIKGDLVVEIRGYGCLRFTSESCEKIEAHPDISLDSLTASRLFFGPDDPFDVCDIPKSKELFVNSIFPLPLYWNGQDRV